MEQREKKLARMRSTLHGLSGEHRALKALYTWRSHLTRLLREEELRSIIARRRRRPSLASLRRWGRASAAGARREAGVAQHTTKARRKGLAMWRGRTRAARKIGLIDILAYRAHLQVEHVMLLSLSFVSLKVIIELTG